MQAVLVFEAAFAALDVESHRIIGEIQNDPKSRPALEAVDVDSQDLATQQRDITRALFLRPDDCSSTSCCTSL